MKLGISAVIVVYNQSELLQKCLKSLNWVDEIILLDVGSSEDIRSLATRFKTKYHRLAHVDIVEEIRQKSLQYASYEYILFIDPDEEVTPDLQKVLTAQVKANEIDYCAIPRQNIVFGKWLEHSRWWPDYQIRFFRHDAVTWPTVLHGQPQYRGRKLELPAKVENAILHYNYLSLDEWLDKNRRYAKKDALDRVSNNQPFTLFEALRLSVSEMMSRFYEGHGYKDGMHGLVLSVLQSFYYFLVYAYYWEAKKYGNLEDSNTIYHFPHTWFRHGFAETLFWDNQSSSGIKKIKEKLVRRMIA